MSILKIFNASFLLFAILISSGCSSKNESYFNKESFSSKYDKNIILIHGLNSNSKIWDSKFMDKISKEYKRNVYTFTYPTGLVDFFNENDYYGEIAKQLKLFIDKNQLDNIVLICHSQGGIIAQKYIIQNINKNKTQKLIMLGTPTIGSVLADYSSFFPLRSKHVASLENETFNLLALQENISYHQNL